MTTEAEQDPDAFVKVRRGLFAAWADIPQEDWPMVTQTVHAVLGALGYPGYTDPSTTSRHVCKYKGMTCHPDFCDDVACQLQQLTGGTDGS